MGAACGEDGQPPPVVVAQTDVDYAVPILFRPEPYDAWSWVAHVGTTSMTIESEICDGDTVLSRARVVVVFVDPATGRPAAAGRRTTASGSLRCGSNVLTMNCAAWVT